MGNVCKSLAKIVQFCGSWSSSKNLIFQIKYWVSQKQESLVFDYGTLLKACVRYFSLFSKEQCSFWLFRTKYFEKKLTFSSFIFPLFHEHAFFHELSCTACLVKTSCFEKIIVCVIETMLVTLLLVQKNKAQREVNQQIKCKSRQNCNSVLKTYSNDLKKHLNTFQVAVLRKSSSKSAYCNSLNPWKLQFFLNQVVNLHILIL